MIYVAIRAILWGRGMGLREIKRQRLSAAVTILRVGGVHHLHRIAEIGHQIGHEERVGVEVRGYALHDGFAGEQWLIAVDHHVQGLRQPCATLHIESLGGGIMVRCRHDHFSSERLGGLFDFFGVGGDIDRVEFRLTSRQCSQTQRIIGLPEIGASGFSKKREDSALAGITQIIFIYVYFFISITLYLLFD